MRKAVKYLLYLLLVGFVGILIFGAYSKKKLSIAGCYFDITDLNGGPLILRWTRVGYPAVLHWEVDKGREVQLLFYQALVPEFNLRSPEILLPATLKDDAYLPVVLIKKDWFPVLLRRLRPGENFTAVVRLVVKSGSKYYVLKRKAKVLYKGTVFFEEGKK